MVDRRQLRSRGRTVLHDCAAAIDDFYFADSTGLGNAGIAQTNLSREPGAARCCPINFRLSFAGFLRPEGPGLSSHVREGLDKDLKER